MKKRTASVNVNANVTATGIEDAFSFWRKCIRVLRLKEVEMIQKMVSGWIEDIATIIWR